MENFKFFEKTVPSNFNLHFSSYSLLYLGFESYNGFYDLVCDLTSWFKYQVYYFFGEKFVYYFLYTLIHAILNTNNLVARRSSDPLNRPLNIWLIRTDEGVHQCSLIIRWSKNCDRKVVTYQYKLSFRSSTVAPQVKRTSGQIDRMFSMDPESGGLSNMQS